MTIKRKGNVCEITVNFIFNSPTTHYGYVDTGILAIPSWALPTAEKTIFTSLYNPWNGNAIGMKITLNPSGISAGSMSWNNTFHAQNEVLYGMFTYFI